MTKEKNSNFWKIIAILFIIFLFALLSVSSYLIYLLVTNKPVETKHEVYYEYILVKYSNYDSINRIERRVTTTRDNNLNKIITPEPNTLILIMCGIIPGAGFLRKNQHGNMGIFF